MNGFKESSVPRLLLHRDRISKSLSQIQKTQVHNFWTTNDFSVFPTLTDVFKKLEFLALANDFSEERFKIKNLIGSFLVGTREGSRILSDSSLFKDNIFIFIYFNPCNTLIFQHKMVTMDFNSEQKI